MSLTAPANNSRYLNPSSITLSASASGPELNDIIASVAFYLNGNLAQTVTQAPFSYSATGLAVGTYTLTAVATDSQGAQTTSAARTFIVSDTNVPPTVSLVTPTDSSRWNAPATVTFQASVSSGEANDSVSVEFFANGVSQGVRSSAPWSITTTLNAASYTITAVATDGQGAQTTSASRTIIVSDTNLPPTVAITSPAAGANFPTAPASSIQINTTATGPEVNGWITKVEFYANATLIGTRTYGPWNFTWTNVPAGAYTLTAIAYDNFNATTTSAAVNITVGPVPALYFIQVDHLNTPRLIADANQNTVWRWDNQEPFGNDSPNGDPNSTGSAFDFALRFPGQYADKETNRVYNTARDYDPNLGRYAESDPIGLQGGLNSYGYITGNPLSYVDPQGRNPFAGVVAGSELGAEIGTAVAPGPGTVIGGVVGGLVGLGIGIYVGNQIIESRRGQSDPVRNQKPFNPGRDCDGKCNKCPPPIYWDAPGDAHGSTGGSHWHGIVWNQDPATCMCYPNRVSGPSPDTAR